ncbi:MAG: response regulator transcription factor [Bacteroidota bacterium]
MTSANPHLFIAEDDPNFGLVLKSYLEINDFQVTLCQDGESAWTQLQQAAFDLHILDVMMPKMDGFTLAEHMQKAGIKGPLVFLTAKALKSDQIQGYKLGAIDYLIKPFDPEILLLKVRAILQQQPQQSSQQSYILGNFQFVPERRSLTLRNKVWQLSPKESDLLHMLAAREGQVVSREEALEHIWGEATYFTAQSMNVYITKLRKYLREDSTQPGQIINLHGKGFILRMDGN